MRKNRIIPDKSGKCVFLIELFVGIEYYFLIWVHKVAQGNNTDWQSAFYANLLLVELWNAPSFI